MLRGGSKKHQMTIENGKSVYLQAVSIKDPTTDWKAVPSARADLVSNVVEPI